MHWIKEQKQAGSRESLPRPPQHFNLQTCFEFASCCTNSVLIRERFKKKNSKKKLTNVSFAFTHTYTLVKTNICGIFSQACLENFEKCNFPQMPVYTGAPVFLRGTWAHCPLPQMQILPLPMRMVYIAAWWKGKVQKKSQGGGSGVLSAPCDQDATLMVQNLYSERELSIKLYLGEKNSKKKLTFDHFRLHIHTQN